MPSLTEISVVIPVYNESESISRLSEALNAQDFDDMEVIFVIDSRTTDDTLDKIRNMTGILKENRIIIQEGTGVLGEARNLGLDAAKGRYVWFLDADDIPYPDFMKTMYGLAEDYKADVCQCNFVRSHNLEYREPKWNDPRTTVMSGREALYYRAGELIPVTAWSMLLRRDFLIENKLRFIEGSYAEDVDFIYRVLEKCETYCYYDKPMYLYYQNPASICFTKQNERGFSEVSAYKDLRKYFDSVGTEFNDLFRRRAVLMMVRSSSHMDWDHFSKYIKSEECKEMMSRELGDPLSPEHVWLRISPLSYYVTINIFLKYIYYRNGKIFGRRLKRT